MRLLLLTLFFTLTLSTCPHPPPTSSTFTLSHHLPSLTYANHFFTPSRLIPLLFGPTITHYRHRHRHFTLYKPRSVKATIRLTRRRNGYIFVFLAHDDQFFPVHMRRSSFYLYLSNSKLYLSFRGAALRSDKAKRRNVYANALAHDMLNHARLVLGFNKCSATIPTHSGVCNNVQKPRWGAVNVPQLRRRGRSWLDLQMQLPNPRDVSNALCKSTGGKEGSVNFLMVIFGQFIDHDLVLTPSGEQPDDASFENERSEKMPFLRSDGLSLRRCCTTGYQNVKRGMPFNRVSSYLDGSVIYGEDLQRAYALRKWSGGELKMIKGRLPRNSEREVVYTVENANRREDERLFAAGDLRANENPVLTALHTVWVREHNRVVREIRNKLRMEGLPVQSDEWMYTQARRVVVAELQCVVYEEWLKVLVGGYLDDYKGYDEKVDAGMEVLFTTAGFRWGHSAIRGRIEAGGRSYKLEEAFFNPSVFEGESLADWLKGAMKVKGMEVDLEHEDSVREFLFSPGRGGVLDLVALNLQRGRDHRVMGYIEARRSFGLSPDLKDIEEGVREKLMKVYGDVDRIELFVGGLAERKVGVLGVLFTRIVAEQFDRLRRGDRFYFERVEWGKFMSGLHTVQKIMAKDVKMKDIIRLNTGVSVQDAFAVE